MIYQCLVVVCVFDLHFTLEWHFLRRCVGRLTKSPSNWATTRIHIINSCADPEGVRGSGHPHPPPRDLSEVGSCVCWVREGVQRLFLSYYYNFFLAHRVNVWKIPPQRNCDITNTLTLSNVFWWRENTGGGHINEKLLSWKLFQWLN